MTEAEIFETLREIVDSLYLNEIVYELEEEFNVRVPDEAFEDLRTVGQAVKFVHGRIHES